MRFFKFLAVQATVVTLLFGATSVNAQTHIPSPRYQPADAQRPENTPPFAEPGVFNYDAQMFAPFELSDYDSQDAPTGFFFTMDRLYISVSRPDNQGINNAAAPTGNDFHWGNRFEFGFMTEEDKGWGIQYSKVEGSFFSAGQDILVPNPFLTTTNVSHVELNRIFRQALKNGGTFEPYAGVRYMGISDKTLEDTQVQVGTATLFNRFKQDVTNSALGAHVGARYARSMGRWKVSADSALATMYNTQRYLASDIGELSGTQTILESTRESSDFVPALDAQLDIAYNFTRDVSFRTGVQMLYAWDGVARANTLTTAINPVSTLSAGPAPIEVEDESFLAIGFTFGIEWKR